MAGVRSLFSLFQDEPKPDAHPLDAAKVEIPVRLGIRVKRLRLITPNVRKFLQALEGKRSTLLFGRAKSDASFTDVLTYRLLEHLEQNPIPKIKTDRLKKAFNAEYQRGATCEDPDMLTSAESRPESATCRCTIL